MKKAEKVIVFIGSADGIVIIIVVVERKEQQDQITSSRRNSRIKFSER